MANTFNHNDKVVITDGGSVGIRTTSPASYYSNSLVVSASGENGITIANPATTGSNYLMFADGTTGNEKYRGFIEYAHTGDYMVLATSGAEKIRITSAGNVGIGTTSPAYKLDVSGSISLGGSGSGLRFTNGGATTTFIDENWGMQLNGDATHPIKVYNASLEIGYSSAGANRGTGNLLVSGNVGIGTTAPDAKLVIVTGSADDSGNSFSFTGYGSKQYVSISKLGFIRSRASDLNGANMHFLDNGGTNRMEMAVTASSMTWYSHALASTFMVFQHTTGNVGIGTTSPRAKLEVNGDIYQSWLDAWAFMGQVYSDGTSYRNGVATNSATRTTQIEARSAGADGEITFLVGTSEVARMVHGGNVGIGTTSPSEKLDVYGGRVKITSGSNGYGWIYGSDVNHSIILRGNRSGTGGDFTSYHQYGGTLADGRGHLFWTGGALADQTLRMQIANDGTYFSGNVGIGTISPIDKLNVNGGITSTGLSDVSNGQVGSIQMGHDGTYGRLRTWNSSPLIYSAYNYQAFETSGSERIRITSAGNVGIGTTAPTYKLDVSGSVRSGNANQSALLVSASGTATTQAAIAIQQLTTEGDTIIFADYEPFAEYGIIARNSLDSIDFTGGTSVGSLDSYSITNRTGNARTAYVKARIGLGSGNSFFGGNVGIGTTTPGSKLTTIGTIQTSRTSAESENLLFYSQQTAKWGSSTYPGVIESYGNNSMIIGSGQNVPIYIARSGAIALTIGTGGNVGIGTTNPGAYLEVYGSTASNDVVGMFTGTGQYGSAIHLKATGTNGSNWRILSTASGSTPGGGYFGLYNDSAGLYRFVISPTGNVGIGTTTPAQKLHVLGSARVTGDFQLTGSNPRIDFNFNSSDALRFYDSRNAAERMRIDSAGNVGIGTTGPSYKLEVSGTSYFSGLAHFGQTAGSGSAFRWGAYGTAVSSDTMLCMNQLWSGSGWSIISSSLGTSYINLGSAVATPDISFGTGGANTAATTRVIIKNDGNVGIGTTSPAYKLDVSGGAIAIRGNAAGNSLRFDDSTGTSRNAMYVDTSNYLNIGNSNYAGVKFVQTATAPNTGAFDGQSVQQAVGTTDNGTVLAEPDAWLAVRVGTTDYAIPMYTTG